MGGRRPTEGPRARGNFHSRSSTTYTDRDRPGHSRRQVRDQNIRVRSRLGIRDGGGDRTSGVAGPKQDNLVKRPSIRQQAVRATWIHRLTPISTMTVSASRQATRGLLGSSAESTQNAMTLLATRQIGQRTSGSIGARRSVFESTVSGGNRENAVFTTLTTRF